MKKLFTLALVCAFSINAFSQMGFGGFGGFQVNNDNLKYSEKFSDINYAGDDNAYHTLDIYLPEEVKDSYPVVIHIYGSAWFSNNSKGAADLNTICAELLKAGYAVVTPNHRAISDAKYPAQIHDIKAVIRFVRGEAKKYKFDTSFVGISGFSSGGHLASLAATTTGEKTYKLGTESVDLEGSLGNYTSFSSDVDAACDWSGPIDLLNMDCGEAMMMNPSPEEQLIGVGKEGNEDKFALLSPITFVDKKDPPMHVFHGKKDNVVPGCQGERMYKALQDAKVESYAVFEEEGGHGMGMYSEENLSKMTSFFDKVRNSKK